MIAAVFIEPHERSEAIQAYKDRLTSDQIERIEDAPEGALIRLIFGVGVTGTTMTIIEEG